MTWVANIMLSTTRIFFFPLPPQPSSASKHSRRFLREVASDRAEITGEDEDDEVAEDESSGRKHKLFSAAFRVSNHRDLSGGAATRKR